MRHCLRRKVAADVYADQFNQQPVSKSQHSATADQSIVAVRDSSVNNRLFPLRLIVIQCKLVFPWPFSVMAPRNASRQPSVVTESSGRSPNKSPPLSESGKLTGYHWQKDYIQSRIMQKVHDVGDKMNSQTWMEQTRILAKERPISFTCILFMAVVGAVPLILFLTFIMASCGISLFSFIFLEGTLLTIVSVFLCGLFMIAACIAFPVALFLGVTYLGATFAFSIFNTTSTKLKKIVEERRRSSADVLDTSSTDGMMFLPPCRPPSCIIDSDESALRRTKGGSFNFGDQHLYNPDAVFYNN